MGLREGEVLDMSLGEYTNWLAYFRMKHEAQKKAVEQARKKSAKPATRRGRR